MTTAQLVLLYKRLLRSDLIKGQTAFADVLGFGKSYISQALKAAPDRRVPSGIEQKVRELYPEVYNSLVGAESLETSVVRESSTTYETSDGLNHESIIYTGPSRLLTTDELATEIPFYDLDFIAGDGVSAIDPGMVAPAYTMKLPGFRGCIAFTAYSDSMEKLIKSGSIMLGRKIDWDDYLEYGQVYGIVMKDNRRFLKYIRKSEINPSTNYLLCSENPAYESFEIPKSKIHNIWLIEGWMQKRS
jgi:phage repressor protein C with HTH and peptisase S24 domain